MLLTPTPEPPAAAMERAQHERLNLQRAGWDTQAADRRIAEAREAIAAFTARNRAACDYTNHLAAQAAADPQGAARVEAERQENEIGNAYYAHS